MKKITIINDHLSVGGIEQYISSLSSILEDNYDIDLIVGYRFNDMPSYHISAKNNIYYLVERPYNQDLIDRFRRRKKYFKYIEGLMWKLRVKWLKMQREIKAIKKLDSDFVITTRIFDALLVSLFCKKRGVKKIAIDFYYPTKLHEILLSWATFAYSKVIVLNEEVKNIYRNRFKNKVFTINNFINTDVEYISDLNNKNILSVGKLSKNKGFYDLLDIMSLLVERDNEIKLYIIGDGREARNLKNKIREKHLENNVILTGFLNQFEIEDYTIIFIFCTHSIYTTIKHIIFYFKLI